MLNLYLYLDCVIIITIIVINLNRYLTFANAEGASKAKRELNGADIYSNCCTLKIEYAKVCHNFNHQYINIYIYIYICVCVCKYVITMRYFCKYNHLNIFISDIK